MISKIFINQVIIFDVSFCRQFVVLAHISTRHGTESDLRTVMDILQAWIRFQVRRSSSKLLVLLMDPKWLPGTFPALHPDFSPRTKRKASLTCLSLGDSTKRRVSCHSYWRGWRNTRVPVFAGCGAQGPLCWSTTLTTWRWSWGDQVRRKPSAEDNLPFEYWSLGVKFRKRLTL